MQDQQQETQAEQNHPQTIEDVQDAQNKSAPPTHERKQDYAYYREVFAGRAMPFAYVDLDLLDENIRQIRTRVAGKRVRLASKSLRCVAILRRILAADACFQGIMCYTAREAAYLAAQGFDDLLIGYPCWHEDDIAAVARATAAGTLITLMVDSVMHIERVEAVASRHGVQLPLCLDIDMSTDFPGLHFGVWRSPLRTAEQARPLIERIAQSQHVRLDGVMGYEAQIAGVGDSYAGKTLKNALVQQLKRRSVREIAARRAALVDLITAYGISLRFVNGGGTGSIATTREELAVTEITVGSGFYSPALFDNYKDFRYQPAAGYAIEIVRQPVVTNRTPANTDRTPANTDRTPARGVPTIYGSGIYTCLGGGYTASGAAGADKLPKPYLPEGAHLTPLEGAGEVQTPIQYKGPIPLALGDPIFMRHAKAGELCERFPHLLLVSNGAIIDEVPTYRGDNQCFI